MIDPITGIAVASGAATLAGLLGKGIKAIRDHVRAKREAKKRGLKNPPNPVIYSDEDIKQIDNLPAEQRNLVNAFTQYMQQDPEGFLGQLPEIDKSGMLQALSDGKFPSAEQLGFPQSQNIIPELMQQTDFGPIEDLARRQFQEKTIPALAERFNALGSLPNRSLQGLAARAGTDLESQLAALRSQYGLQRAGLLGNLQQKQQALDTGKAQAAGALGLGVQGQRFGQQQALANFGLQENQQELARRAGGLSSLPSLLGSSQYSNVGIQGSPGLSDYLLGGGLSGLGVGLQGMLQQNLLQQLNSLNK